MVDQASPAHDSLEVRSYRAVFDLERRIYRIDRLRLNPGGVPLRGLAYLLGALALSAIASAAPVTELAMRLAPWYLRYVGAPVVVAAVLTMIRVDGRPFHLAAAGLLRHACSPRSSAGLRRWPAPLSWRPGEVLVLADGSEASPRRLRFTGPGSMLVAVAHERVEPGGGSRGRLGVRVARGASPLGRAQVIQIARGTRVEIAGASASSRRLTP